MDIINNVLEVIGALYTLASVIGHLPFVPKSVQDFCNKLAANLKSDVKSN